MKLKVKCPAKINLSLKVFQKQGDFHPIESVMQTVSLYDYLTVEKNEACPNINLEGNSKEISYGKDNLIIKAANLFLEKAKINCGLNIYIEKNIPVAAGLAGGSTDAAGMVFALSEIFSHPLDEKEIHKINSTLGSDINFCYKGGHAICRGKGDDITQLPFEEFDLTIVKPKGLKISTKDAYLAFDNLKEKSTMPNDLEFAITPLYPKLKELQEKDFQMSGSGPSFFIKKSHANLISHEKYEIYENLKAIPHGVCLI